MSALLIGWAAVAAAGLLGLAAADRYAVAPVLATTALILALAALAAFITGGNP